MNGTEDGRREMRLMNGSTSRVFHRRIRSFEKVGRASGTGVLWLVAALCCLVPRPVGAQETEARVIDLTLERMVDLTMSNSYRVRQVNLGIERRRHRLRANEARLKSRVDLRLSTPQFEAVSEPRWNSDLQRNEIIHENTRRWEADLSIRQPVILFGYPTNGYLSLNNRMYRYVQIGEDDERDVRYYNRYFIEYEQPLFQPNELKNDLEEAELDLERAELSFQDDVVDLVDDVSRDYFELFEDAYRRVIYARFVEILEEATRTAEALAGRDTTRAIEADQIRVELANAREQLQQAGSQFRLRAADVKQRLRIPAEDSIALSPSLDVEPVQVASAEAIDFATSMTPRLRQLDISHRMDEIDLANTKGRNSFRMDLELSYGREMQDPRFERLWGDPTNSYTVELNARIPIWDWGEREERIAAERISLEQTELRMEEVRTRIASDVRNEVRNLEEYESRALAMEENLDLAREISATSLDRFREGAITALDLLQSLRRETDTAENFLEAYLGWRRALLRLQELTFYDFERDVPVLERFDIDVPDDGAPTS